MDIALVLDRLLPAAAYAGSLTANTQEAFDWLTWSDGRAKPTWQQVLDEWDIYSEEVLFSHLASYRYQKEVGGIVLGGLPVRTDDRSKTLLSGKYSKALQENDPTKLNKVKLTSGFIDLTNQQLIDVFIAVADHVQKCFDAEASVFTLIDNNTLTTEEAIEDAFDSAYAE